MKKLLPPFHRVMENEGECDLANDRIAFLEIRPTVAIINPSSAMEVTGWDADNRLLTITCT